MKAEKLTKVLKIFIIVLSIALVIAIPVSIITYKEEEPLKENDCIKKGNICTVDEIFDGVEVAVEVSKGKTYTFNVISNDEKTMTLLMNNNLIKENDWHGEMVNVKGPVQAIMDLYNKTKTWVNVPQISNFEYKDEGKLSFEEFCNNGTAEPNYDCSNTIYTSRGYNSIKISEGVTTINYNVVTRKPNVILDTQYIDKSSKTYARLITLSEIRTLSKDNKYPAWLTNNLKENEGYWTLTSSTAMKNGYQQGAFALANVDDKASIESLFVQKDYQKDFKIGLRPVITIKKK